MFEPRLRIQVGEEVLLPVDTDLLSVEKSKLSGVGFQIEVELE